MLVPQDDYLMHYGVKGMKWGVRRQRAKAAVQNVTNRSKQRVKNFYAQDTKTQLKKTGKRWLKGAGATLGVGLAGGMVSAAGMTKGNKSMVKAGEKITKLASAGGNINTNLAGVALAGTGVNAAYKYDQKRKQKRR